MSSNTKNLSHVPCKFYKQGICQAGTSCPFSHNVLGSLAADKLPCKYFQKGNCKFGLKCALGHYINGERINKRRERDDHKYDWNGNGIIGATAPMKTTFDLFDNPHNATLDQGFNSYGNSNASGNSIVDTSFDLDIPIPRRTSSDIWKSSASSSSTSPWKIPTFSPFQTTPFSPATTTTTFDDELLQDYVPANLSDVVLSKSDYERRDSRSQSGTLLVRPNFDGWRKGDEVFMME